jgi:dihydrofolate reductase
MTKFLKKQNKVSISLISALAENRVIGNQSKIPWHIRQDLIHFRDKTIGHTVIMGRKTFNSLLAYYQKSGKPLPQRAYIIVTRDDGYRTNQTNCFIVHSIKEAIQLGKSHFVTTSRDREIFVAGGAQIYQQTIDLADKLYLTIVKGQFKGDAYFPPYDQFKIVTDTGWQKEGKDQFKFVNLVRK